MVNVAKYIGLRGKNYVVYLKSGKHVWGEGFVWKRPERCRAL